MHPLQARAILKKFVTGRFVFKPVVGSGRPRYEVTATASTRLILGAVVPALLPPRAPLRSDGGEEPSRWWPQRDSNPCFSHDRVFANSTSTCAAAEQQPSHATRTCSLNALNSNHGLDLNQRPLGYERVDGRETDRTRSKRVDPCGPSALGARSGSTPLRPGSCTRRTHAGDVTGVRRLGLRTQRAAASDRLLRGSRPGVSDVCTSAREAPIGWQRPGSTQGRQDSCYQGARAEKSS